MKDPQEMVCNFIQFPLIYLCYLFYFPIILSLDACYIFGYGSETLSGDPTLDLRLAPVKIISHELCMKELGPWNAPELDSGMFCAIGESPGVDACPVIEIINLHLYIHTTFISHFEVFV